MLSRRNQFDIERYVKFNNLQQSLDRPTKSKETRDRGTHKRNGKKLVDFRPPEQVKGHNN